MRYAITGADSETGERVELTTEAKSAAAAEEWAQAKGILVNEVVPVASLARNANLRRSTPETVVVDRRIEIPGPPADRPAEAPPQPIQQTIQQIVHVHANKESRPGGVASGALLFGVLSLIFCWAPYFGLIFAVLGGILGVLGILAAALGTKGLGYSIVGIILAVIATPVAVTSSAIGAAASAASDRSHAMQEWDRRQSKAQPQETPTGAAPVIEAERPKPSSDPVPAPAVESARSETPAPKPIPAPSPRTKSAPEIRYEAKLGDVHVRVIGIWIEGEPASQVMKLSMRVENVGTRRRITYRSWRGGAELRDQNGAIITSKTTAGDEKRIDPGKSIMDLLIFDLPAEGTKSLDLTLPGDNVTETGSATISMPASLISRDHQ